MYLSQYFFRLDLTTIAHALGGPQEGTLVWKELPPTKFSFRFSSVFIALNIFAGCFILEPVDMVEAFSVSQWQWRTLASMSHPRSNGRGVALSSTSLMLCDGLSFYEAPL